ncbi:LPS export ABC transporter permease LptF [Gemmobacter aquarius]|uniref:LPS export ABC transporter permease LptF n=1 Tax=Paragemmobacter aquarius TaxID=2169400 RepID=A0A2S0ULE0_9RHOB|nr:LPS export ABC transporter permease LptF [Gemmobacter aquarius]AWB48622.1 LPS export ABC transporter permease LptF [Gemmobacter aquarius]
MSRFDRYLLSQLLALFGFFALILVTVYWINRAVGLFDKLLGDGQSALVFLEFSLLILPNAIRLVLPVAAFAATVYVTNRLMQESELVVMQATGFSSFRLARPIIYFGLIVTLLHLALMNLLVPWSNAMLNTRQQALSQDMTARYMNEGQFMQPASGVTLYIRDITDKGELEDVFIADDRSRAVRTVYNASRALIVRSETGPKLLMLDGTSQRLDRDGSRKLSITRFADATYDLGTIIQTAKARGPEPRDLTSLALFTPEGGLDWADPATQSAVTREIQSRLSQPFLSLASAMLGFSALLIGAFSRFGLGRQILGAVIGLILVQLISTTSTSLTLQNVALWPTLYAGPLTGCLISVLLLWVSQRPRRSRRVVV